MYKRQVELLVTGHVVAIDLGLDRRLADTGSGIELGDLDLCLLYTSDAADERSSVDLGGRRIIKKKKRE